MVGVVGVLATILLAGVMSPVRTDFGNTNVALLLVVVIVGAAALGGRTAGALTALSASLAYNFFETDPIRSLKVEAGQDVWTVLLLLVVGLAVGELATLGRREHALLRRERAGLHHLERASALVAERHPLQEVWTCVRQALVDELRLQSVRFEPAAVARRAGHLPVMGRTGAFRTTEMHWTLEGMELPRGGVQLAVQAGNRFFGRLVLVPTPGRGSHPGERRLAVALADQLALALEREPVDTVLA
jgi:K+-sensing histidine kinase KdpD